MDRIIILSCMSIIICCGGRQAASITTCHGQYICDSAGMYTPTCDPSMSLQCVEVRGSPGTYRGECIDRSTLESRNVTCIPTPDAGVSDTNNYTEPECTPIGVPSCPSGMEPHCNPIYGGITYTQCGVAGQPPFSCIEKTWGHPDRITSAQVSCIPSIDHDAGLPMTLVECATLCYHDCDYIGTPCSGEPRCSTDCIGVMCTTDRPHCIPAS